MLPSEQALVFHEPPTRFEAGLSIEYRQLANSESEFMQAEKPVFAARNRNLFRRRTWTIIGFLSLAAYFAAYYATYRMGTNHHSYVIGSDWSGWEIPLAFADPFFAPAHWIDHHTIRAGLKHD
jgi:hypothetical protein